MDELFPQLDLVSDPNATNKASSDSNAGKPKPFLGVLFACCNVYARVYRDRNGGAFYQGHCPKCFKKIRFIEGAGGRRDQFFRAE